MKRRAAGMTIALFHAIVLTACAVQPERTEPLQDARSATDLLHNMRAVLVRGSLAQRTFFSDAQLKAAFGGSSIEWIRNTPTHVNCHLGPIDALPVRSREPGLPRISFLWYDASPGERDKPAGTFSTWCACELTSTDIEAVFGDVDRTIDRDRRLDGSHRPTPPRATHPLGNKVATYTLRAPDGYVSSFEVQYDHEGRVHTMAGRTGPAPATRAVEVQNN